MDLQINKSGQLIKLSELGFYNIVIEDSSPSLSISSRTVKGRSGHIYDSMTFDNKTIKVTARILKPSLKDFMAFQDDINGLLLDGDPFYITKMYPNSDNLYDFELPGAKAGDIDFSQIEHTLWHYRWKVVIHNTPSFDFIGKTSEGVKYNVSFSFVTAELPFGETEPKEVTVSGDFIDYSGTAPLSQLEVPFVVELTSEAEQGSFHLTIDGRRFEYTHGVNCAVGDKFLLTGIETTLNGDNVNNRTNYEYFVIRPSINKKVSIQTDFVGTIKIINFLELYK